MSSGLFHVCSPIMALEVGIPAFGSGRTPCCAPPVQRLRLSAMSGEAQLSSSNNFSLFARAFL
eukprot:5441606-Pleurochrysis_carterae.AAC.2